MIQMGPKQPTGHITEPATLHGLCSREQTRAQVEGSSVASILASPVKGRAGGNARAAYREAGVSHVAYPAYSPVGKSRA
jgi:hypothetical protein